MISRSVVAAAALAGFVAALARPAAAEPVEGTHLFALDIAGAPEGLRSAAGDGLRPSSRAELFLDLIEHLHFGFPTPYRLDQVEHYADTVTRFLNAWRLARRSQDGAVSLAAVERGSEARNRLEQFLEAAGFRLRRDSRRFVARPDRGSEGDARRKALSAAGFPVTGLDARLNKGEAVVFEPLSFGIPSPLPPEVWSTVIFERDESRDRVGFRLLTDRRAAFLYYGLLSMTPETVQFLAAQPELLRELYERDAAGVAAIGRSLIIENGQVAVPGGPDAAALWKRLLRADPDDPGDFFKALLRSDKGELPFLYDAIYQFDAPRQRFALGLSLSGRRQSSNFWRLYEVTAANVRLSPDQPWNRGFPEPTVLLSQVAVDGTGQPLRPAWEELWKKAFSGRGLPRNPERDVRNVEKSDPLEPAWLVERVFEDRDLVVDRTAMFLFAQRRFGGVESADLPAVLTTLRGFVRFRSLVALLDRMGIESPSTYAAAIRHAAQLDEMRDRQARRDALSGYQGILAILDRARHTGSLSLEAANELVASVSAVPFNEDRGYEGGLAAWVVDELLPAFGANLENADTGEATVEPEWMYGVTPRERVVLQAMSGALGDDGWGRRVTTSWEGFAYVADLRGASLGRLLETREVQGGASLDAALDLWAMSNSLAAVPESVEDVRRLAERLRAVAGALPERVGSASLDVAQNLGRVSRDLEHVGGEGDVARRAPEAGRRLRELADALLGDVLRALVYAVHLGDPVTGILAGGDLSVRHDFGLDLADGDPRRPVEWRVPAAQMVPDRPWYAEGSLLGLELATADLRLEQITAGLPPVDSGLPAGEREGMAALVALFNPFGRTEGEIQEIAEAVGAGRQRLAELGKTPGKAPGVASAGGLTGWRRTLLGWIAGREPEWLDSWLSVRELLWLGLRDADDAESGGSSLAAGRFRAWGGYSRPLDGCLCLRLAGPETFWEGWRGRGGSGLLSAMAADLPLWVGEGLGASALPASLSRAVLEVAMRHLLDQVQPSHAEDWATVLRYPSTLRRADLEDYVSSLTGRDVLRPAPTDSPSDETVATRRDP